MIDKPDLNENLLIHFGIKGMKWGKRKQRPDEAQRKNVFKNAEQKKKVVIGLAVVGGAIAVGALLTKRGRNKMTDAAVTNYVQQRTARAQANNNPFGQLARKFKETKAASVPSPDHMIAEARMAGVRNQHTRRVNQALTDKSWRDSANFSRKVREMGAAKNNTPSLEEVRRRLQDPNYVWEL